MSDVYREFTICDLTAQMEDGRYMARAAVVGRGGSRMLFQRFLDFEMFDNEAEATARALGGARAWIDEEMWDVPLALPTNLSKAIHIAPRRGIARRSAISDVSPNPWSVQAASRLSRKGHKEKR